MDSRERDPILFKMGYHMTEEDRPRKKFRSEDYTDEELAGDYGIDDEDDFDLEP